jgi:hypothetical protein
LQTPATHELSLVKRLGQRFESARRISISSIDKPNTQSSRTSRQRIEGFLTPLRHHCRGAAGDQPHRGEPGSGLPVLDHRGGRGLRDRLHWGDTRDNRSTDDLLDLDRCVLGPATVREWARQRRDYPRGEEREISEPLPRRPARHRRTSSPGGQPSES